MAATGDDQTRQLAPDAAQTPGVSVAPLQCELRALFATRPPHRALAMALASIGKLFGARYAVIHARVGFTPYSEEWGEDGYELPDNLRDEVNSLMLRVADQGHAQSVRLRLAAGTAVVVSAVLFGEGAEQVGHAALLFGDLERSEVHQLAAQVEALMGFLALLLTGRGAIAAGSPSGPVASAQALDSVGRPMRLLFQVVSDLANRHGLSAAAIGLVRGRSVRVALVSGQADLRDANPSVRAIRSAMEEALDFGEPVMFPAGARAPESGTSQPKMHAAWRRTRNVGIVASVPLRVGQQVIAVLSFATDTADGLSKEKVARIAAEAAPYAALIDVSSLAARPILRHVADEFSALRRRRLGTGRRAWITVACSLLVLLLLLFGRLPHSLTVPCTVRASDRRTISCPREGTLVELFVRPGDRVRAGQRLAALDSHEDTLAKIELQAQLATLDAQIDKALADRDAGQQRIFAADRQNVAARIAVVEARVEQAQIRAPSAAVVISGELRNQLGARLAMGAPLFELARYDRALVELRIPEHAILEAKATQAATFAATASPEISYRLDRLLIDPATTVTEGHNVFLAEAVTDATLDNLAPGMEGVARLETGWRSAWWVVGHRVFDWLRLNLWL
ncbi:MAG TPA: HlyD family efflux transporter periplasmic adaptor subunit [Planctomycetota bacterium]|nr:HlyD family efflux transporter periplasmic adaptor subunit [Planctomycetota bacterium]